jgi:hypothetical protein
VTGIACPSATRCVAVDSGGKVIVGVRAPAASQLRALLLHALQPRGPAGDLAAIRTGGGYSLTLAAPAPGKLTISWIISSGRHRQRLAVGHATIANVGAIAISVELTRQGRAALKHTKRLRVLARATLALAHGTGTTTATATISLGS